MSTIDQADKRRSKQPNRLHFVGLGETMNTMECKKYNNNLKNKNNEDNERCERCVKFRHHEIELLANNDIIKKNWKSPS